jgi:hypothetical protein
MTGNIVGGAVVGAGLGYLVSRLHGDSGHGLRWMTAMGIACGTTGALKVWLADWSKQRLIRRPIYQAILFAVLGAGFMEARRGPWLAPEWHVERAASVVDGIGGAIMGAVLGAVVGAGAALITKVGPGKGEGRGRRGKTAEIAEADGSLPEVLPASEEVAGNGNEGQE